MENNALYHHGTKGMRWGIRRYQNKDGSLTPAGQKRYNKEVEKLKKETAKVKAAEKLAANNKKVQAKFDKLDAKKAALEARKKALKDGKDPEEEKKKAEESAEEKKARLLKSTDPKELYENRDMLSTMELNERLNRIDTEARLQGKIVVEHEKTGMDYVDGLKTKIDKGTALFRSVDNAYSSVANSAIGKTLAKKLGLEPPKKKFDINEFWENRHSKSAQEMMEVNKWLTAEESIAKKRDASNEKAKEEAAAKQAEKDAKKAEKEAKEAEKKAEKERKKAQKQVDDYNERWQKGDTDDNVSSKSYDPDGDYGRKNTDASGNRRGDDTYREYTNKLGIEQKPTRISDDDVEIIEPDWYSNFKSRNSSATPNSVNSSTRDNAEAFIFGYLEDRNGR